MATVTVRVMDPKKKLKLGYKYFGDYIEFLVDDDQTIIDKLKRTTLKLCYCQRTHKLLPSLAVYAVGSIFSAGKDQSLPKRLFGDAYQYARRSSDIPFNDLRKQVFIPKEKA